MKNNELYEIFSSIESSNKDTLIFDLPDIIKKENIINHRGLNTNISENSQYFGTGRHRGDIKIGKEFDVLFSRNNPKDYVKVKSVLEYISVNPDIEEDFLPAGYSGVCLVNFPEGKPTEKLSNLCEFGEDKYGKSCDVLYLTSQEVMDKILDKLG